MSSIIRYLPTPDKTLMSGEGQKVLSNSGFCLSVAVQHIGCIGHNIILLLSQHHK